MDSTANHQKILAHFNKICILTKDMIYESILEIKAGQNSFKKVIYDTLDVMSPNHVFLFLLSDIESYRMLSELNHLLLNASEEK
jgi:hypothetical protein